MAAEYDGATRSGRQIESERWDSILAAMEHYRVEKDHALLVRQAAMSLFRDLKSVHRLPPEYEEWLSAAAMLYEVGDYINRNGRHRHSHYIISNSGNSRIHTRTAPHHRRRRAISWEVPPSAGRSANESHRTRKSRASCAAPRYYCVWRAP